MKKKGEKLTKNNNKEKTQRKQKGFRLTSETLIIKKRKNRTKTERSADCVRQTLIISRSLKQFIKPQELTGLMLHVVNLGKNGNDLLPRRFRRGIWTSCCAGTATTRWHWSGG